MSFEQGRVPGETFGRGEDGADAGDDTGDGGLEVRYSVRAHGVLEEGERVEEGDHERGTVVVPGEGGL